VSGELIDALRSTTGDEQVRRRATFEAHGKKWLCVTRIQDGDDEYLIARRPTSSPRSPRLLSKREAQVVDLVRQGLHTKAVAFRLGIADSTVRVLLQRAALKLQMSTRQLKRDTGS
jgi:DNA-binding NarL/FixJ family response regulator